jgi:hypothetical protein
VPRLGRARRRAPPRSTDVRVLTLGGVNRRAAAATEAADLGDGGRPPRLTGLRGWACLASRDGRRVTRSNGRGKGCPKRPGQRGDGRGTADAWRDAWKDEGERLGHDRLAAEYWASGSARSTSSARRGTWLLVLDLAWVRWERPLAVDIPRDRGFSGQLPHMDAHLGIERT